MRAKTIKKKNKIPKLPLLFCLFSFGCIWAYLYLPMFNPQEPTSGEDNRYINKEVTEDWAFSKSSYEKNYSYKKPPYAKQEESLFSKYYKKTQDQEIKTEKITTNFDDLYSVLDYLKTLSITNEKTPTIIVNSLLKYKKYPIDLIKVEKEIFSQTTLNNKINTTVAYFDIQSGVIKLNKDALKTIKTEELVAIIAHELEHFDIIAKLYKKYDVKNNSEININGKKYKLPLNKAFWDNASEYANIKNFNPTKYIMAFIDYIKQNNIYTLSIYPYLNQISKHFNNELEIKAYNLSNNILNYYKINDQELAIKTLANEFKQINNKIKTNTNNFYELKNEEECLFDYILIQSLIEENQKFKEYYNESILYENGDMTNILKAVVEDNKNIFQNNTTPQTYTKTINLLKKMQTKLSEKVSQETMLEAMDFKINTTLNNIFTENALNPLKDRILNYLNYIKRQKIERPEQELKYLITLICIENKIYTNNTNSFHSFYSKVPNELYKIYQIEKLTYPIKEESEELKKKKEQKNKFALYKKIYENQAFINEKENRASNLSNSDLLKELTEENKINIKNIVQ